MLVKKETITSREIAELTGKQHKHVMRSIRDMEETWVNLGQPKFGLSYYTNSQNKQMPEYQLNKTECLYIATKFNDEARARLVLRWEELEKSKQMSPAETLLWNAQMLVEQERQLRQHDERINILEAKTTTRPDYFTIAGYASYLGVKVNLKKSGEYGRKASKICKNEGWPIDQTKDPRFGYVNMYPQSVLKRVF